MLFSVTLAGVSGSTLIPPSIPATAESLGVSPTTAALVLSAYTLPGVVVALPVGFLADRFGRKAVMIPALLFHALGGGLCVFAPDLKTLLVLRFLQGIGSAGLVNLVVVTLGDLLTGTTRARLIGYNAAVLMVGATTFPTLGGLLASRNWRLAYLPFWTVLAIALAVAAILPNTKGKGSEVEEGVRDPGGPWADLRQVIGVPAVGRLMLGGFILFVLIFGGILAAVPLMLGERLLAGPRTIGMFLTVGSAASMIMAVAGGRLRERYSPSRILLVAFSAYAAGMSLLAVVSLTASRPLGLIAIALCGIGDGMAIVVLQTRATEVAPAGLRGTSVAMFVSSARLGQTAGPVIAKAGLDRIGFAASFVGFAVLAGLVAVVQLRRTRSAEGERDASLTAPDKR